MALIIRSACFVPRLTSTTGRQCGVAAGWRPLYRKRRRCAVERARSSLHGYRERGVSNSIVNISQSGVMFHGPQQLPANALVEMVFEMPEEISGQKNTSVLCQGRLIRAKEAHDTKDAYGLAASILDYKFIHQD